MNVHTFLKRCGVDFEMIDHEPTHTAQLLAHAVHISGKNVAKPVMLRADDGYALVVLPAHRSVDVEAVKQRLGAEHVDLAMESECAHEFVDCEYGARLPFGSQYGMRTLLDESLTKDDHIVFEGNRHDQAIRMQLRDYLRLEIPLVADLSHPW